MPFDAFVVYDSADNNLIAGLGLTQEQADARALEDAGWVAYQGQIQDIPDLARNNGDWRFDAAAVRVRPSLADFTPIQLLQQDIQAGHDRLLAWSQALILEGVGHPAHQIALGHNYIAGGHLANYLVAHNYREAGRDPWTIMQRRVYFQQMASGSSDVTDPYSFFVALHADEDHLIDEPDGPVLWVNPDTGLRVPLADAIAATGGAYLDRHQLPSQSIIGALWISGVNA